MGVWRTEFTRLLALCQSVKVHTNCKVKMDSETNPVRNSIKQQVSPCFLQLSHAGVSPSHTEALNCLDVKPHPVCIISTGIQKKLNRVVGRGLSSQKHKNVNLFQQMPYAAIRNSLRGSTIVTNSQYHRCKRWCSWLWAGTHESRRTRQEWPSPSFSSRDLRPADESQPRQRHVFN